MTGKEKPTKRPFWKKPLLWMAAVILILLTVTIVGASGQNKAFLFIVVI